MSVEIGGDADYWRKSLEKSFSLNNAFHPLFGENFFMASSTLSKKKKKKGNYQENLILQDFRAKTMNQQEFYDTIRDNTITIALGPAGVGKTLVALHLGISAIFNGDIDKILYIRSDVGLDHQRKRGALPGTLDDKIRPLIMPIKDNIPFIVHNPNAFELLLSSGKIEPTFLEDIRGRSFSRTLMIADEAQNMVPSNIKTILSRVSSGSKVVLIGDTSQADLEVFKRNNGLMDAYYRLKDLKEVGTVQFTREDIVRNGVLKEILLAYEGIS